MDQFLTTHPAHPHGWRIWVLISIYFTFPMFFTILSLVVIVEEINILQALPIILQVPLLLYDVFEECMNGTMFKYFL